MYRTKVEKSAHKTSTIVSFYLLMFIILINLMMTYFALAFYFIFLNMTASAIFSHYYIEQIGEGASVYVFSVFFYAIAVFGLFFYSLLCSKPEMRTYNFMFISSILGIFLIGLFILAKFNF